MGRRRKNRQGDTREAPLPANKPAPAATTSLGALFKEAGLVKVAPSQSAKPAARPPVANAQTPQPVSRPAPKISPAAELRMLNDAYAGVRPLSKPALSGAPPRPIVAHRVRDEELAEEAAARARLAALVSGGVRFKIIREDDYVQGYRSDASPKLLARVSGKGFSPDATLDLHGQRASKVQEIVASFARMHHRKGARQLLMIAGKGLHSADGVCVLRDALIDALTQGAAAPIVVAFATAHASQGGTGAVAVLLA